MRLPEAAGLGGELSPILYHRSKPPPPVPGLSTKSSMMRHLHVRLEYRCGVVAASYGDVGCPAGLGEAVRVHSSPSGKC